MKSSALRQRPALLVGILAGFLLVAVKLVVVLPADIAQVYGASLLLTLVIAFGDLVDFQTFTRYSKQLNFVLGFLLPLDCYAILILLRVPLPN